MLRGPSVPVQPLQPHAAPATVYLVAIGRPCHLDPVTLGVPVAGVGHDPAFEPSEPTKAQHGCHQAGVHPRVVGLPDHAGRRAPLVVGNASGFHPRRLHSWICGQLLTHKPAQVGILATVQVLARLSHVTTSLRCLQPAQTWCTRCTRCTRLERYFRTLSYIVLS